MELLLFVVLNGSTSILGLLVNLFYILCFLTQGRDAKRALRQPVKLLFLMIMVYSILLQLTQLVIVALKFWMCSIFIRFGFHYTLRICTMSCMSSFVWLSVFYYTKIVPNQRPFFLWIRRNIKTLVYCGLLCNKLYFILKCVVDTTNSLSILTNNDTLNNIWSVEKQWTRSALAMIWCHIFYLMSFAVMMAGSWTATLVYLCKHMKNMEGRSLSSLHQKQMRVTITGLIQTILFLSCASWLVMMQFGTLMNFMDIGQFDSANTGISFYVLIMSVNVGLSQSLFRQMASSILSKVKAALRFS